MAAKLQDRFRIVLKEPKHKYMKCVYLIKIGRLRYIGRTFCLSERAYAHENTLNKVLKNYSYYANSASGSRDSISPAYLKIAQYILENPGVKEVTIEVISHQQCSNMLAMVEKSYIEDGIVNPDFCNVSLGNDNDRSEIWNRWTASIVGDTVYYYDQLAPSLRVTDASSRRDFDANRKALIEYKKTKAYNTSFVIDRIKLLRNLDPQNKDWDRRIVKDGAATLAAIQKEG